MVDRVADSFELVKQTSGKAAVSATNFAAGGIGHITRGSVKAAETARNGISSAYDGIAHKKDRVAKAPKAKIAKPKMAKTAKEPKQV